MVVAPSHEGEMLTMRYFLKCVNLLGDKVVRRHSSCKLSSMCAHQVCILAKLLDCM